MSHGLRRGTRGVVIVGGGGLAGITGTPIVFT